MTVPEEYKKTVRSALNMLAYRENTKKGLSDKLKMKGYSSESIEFAIEYVETKHLLDEKRYLYRLVETLAKSKYYGIRRIKMELMQKGFDSGLIYSCFEDAISDIDFEDICIEYAKRNPCADREKLYAKLMRLGHKSEHISRACKSVFEDEYL